MDGGRVEFKQLECKCGYSWRYAGCKPDWTNCPKCKAHVNTNTHINDDSKCKLCGARKRLIVHRKHVSNKYGVDVGDVVCKKCDTALHKGYELCPECKKNYYDASWYKKCYICNKGRNYGL